MEIIKKQLKWFWICAILLSCCGIVVVLLPVLFEDLHGLNSEFVIIACITGFVFSQVMAMLLFLFYKRTIIQLIKYKQDKDLSFPSILFHHLHLEESKAEMDLLKTKILEWILEKRKKQ